MGVSRTLIHHAESGFNDKIKLDSISELIPDGRHVLWLDIQDPTSGDLELLRREFGFHELALEDVARRHQRAKLDHYGEYYFIVLYALNPGRSDELHLFIGQNYLVTIHYGEVPEIAETAERWRKNADRMEPGVAMVVYSLLDAVVDAYFPVVDDIAERVERLEQGMFNGGRQHPMAELFALKKELLNLRRTLTPERDVLNIMTRQDDPILGQHNFVYFQDVYDHVIRVLESIDLYRDQLTGLLEAHLSVVSNRLNSVMKRMTALATILMSVNLIASIYGMNFEFMPELKWEYGYPYTIGLMAAVGLILVAIFKRIDWL
jgi:magnesium transporter